MAAGVTDRPWEIADIVNLQDGAKKSAKAAKLENSYKTFGAACKARTGGKNECDVKSRRPVSKTGRNGILLAWTIELQS